MPGARRPTGVGPLDALLGGGLDPDGITELYGEGGSAKTILCVEATVRTALDGRWVVYIDTEGLSVDRLEAVAGARRDEVLARLWLATPRSLAEQGRAVRRATVLARDAERPLGLIVLDSATLYYRLTLGRDDEEDGRRALATQLADLLAASLATEVPVLLTNQVWRRPQTGTLEPIGGSFVDHVAKTIVRLDRLPGAHRRAVLVKHRALPEGSAELWITGTGVTGASKPS